MCKKIECLASFIVFFLLLAPASQSSSRPPISTSGVIQYGNGNTFVNRGAVVSIEVFIPSSINYQASAWQSLKNAGVNTLCVWGGISGDVAHFNINNYPNEWAQNLDNFLSAANQNGIIVYFFSMGNSWGTLFGIIYAGGGQTGPLPATPLADAYAILDKMAAVNGSGTGAGQNALGKNFLADPRVLGWRSSNEVELTDQTVYSGSKILDWNLAICDYIRAYGGKAWLSSPAVNGHFYLETTIPLIQGHVDFIETHAYLAWAFVNTCNSNYTQFYNSYKDYITNHVVNSRGSWSLDKIIIGEFGVWHGGPASDLGLSSYTFTDVQRQTYFQAVYDVFRDVGIQNTCPFYFFAVKHADGTIQSPDYGVVDTNGNPYPFVYDVVQNAYT